MLSDCEKCWDTPCVCSWDYRTNNPKWIREQYNLLGKVLKVLEQMPNAKFSSWSEKETADDKEFMKRLEDLNHG